MQRILVIDDEAIFREATTFALQRKGFETLEAADGVLAVLLDLLSLVVVEVGELHDRGTKQKQEYGRH